MSLTPVEATLSVSDSPNARSSAAVAPVLTVPAKVEVEPLYVPAVKSVELPAIRDRMDDVLCQKTALIEKTGLVTALPIKVLLFVVPAVT